MKATKQVITNSLRDTLKSVMQKELEMLPETLAALEPAERLNMVCKLMPYVFPKVETIHANEGEPLQIDTW